MTNVCFYWPCLLCPLPLWPRPLPPLCSSPCSCWIPLIGTTLTTGCWWNSLLLFITQSALDLLILTPSFTCLAIDDWKDSSTFIEKSTCWPSCSIMQCFQKAFSSLFNLNPSACSLPLVYPLFPVSPSYSVHLPALRQPKQQILYPDPFLSQLPPPVVQGKQSSLSHPFFFNGSAFAIDLITFPALLTPGILQKKLKHFHPFITFCSKRKLMIWEEGWIVEFEALQCPVQWKQFVMEIDLILTIAWPNKRSSFHQLFLTFLHILCLLGWYDRDGKI